MPGNWINRFLLCDEYLRPPAHCEQLVDIIKFTFHLLQKGLFVSKRGCFVLGMRG